MPVRDPGILSELIEVLHADEEKEADSGSGNEALTTTNQQLRDKGECMEEILESARRALHIGHGEDKCVHDGALACNEQRDAS